VRPARTAAVAAAAVALSLLPAPAAAADARGDRTVSSRAVATVRHDGAVRTDTDFDVSLSARRLSGATNVSVAYARCTDCRALTASFQVVLVRRPPAELALTNRAVAVTDRCQRCEALSWAYQWVVLTGTDHRLSPSGQWRLRLLDRRLRLLVRSAPPAAELARGVAGLAAQVQQVLATEVRTRVVPGPRVWRSRARR
jgi:hypothetical protein